MAFVCTAMRAKGKPLQVDSQYGHYAVTVPVGYDSLQPYTYYLMAQMYDVPEKGVLEYAFPFWTSNNRRGLRSHTYDSSDVSAVVDRDCRKHMAELLLSCTSRLLEHVRPQEFMMVTYLSHLPPKAMVKYAQLCALFISHGYDVADIPRNDGKHEWRMSRHATDGRAPLN